MLSKTTREHIIERFIKEIAAGMRSNFLELNDDKSELLPLAPHTTCDKLNSRSIHTDHELYSVEHHRLGICCTV